MIQPPAKPKGSDRAAAARSKPKAAAALQASDRHYGEGAASAWETWNQLQHHRAHARGDDDNALAPPRKPKSS